MQLQICILLQINNLLDTILKSKTDKVGYYGKTRPRSTKEFSSRYKLLR